MYGYDWLDEWAKKRGISDNAMRCKKCRTLACSVERLSEKLVVLEKDGVTMRFVTNTSEIPVSVLHTEVVFVCAQGHKWDYKTNIDHLR